MDASSELRQLHKPLRYLSTQAQKKRDEVTRLQHELAQAEEELQGLDADYKKTLVYYARTDCLELATMMYEKLPVEIREMIYEYLCVDPDRPIPVGLYYHFRRYDRPYVYAPPYSPLLDFNPLGELLFGDAESESDTSVEDDAEPQGTSAVWGRELQVDPVLVKRISSLRVEQDEDNLELDSNCTVLPDGRVKEEHTHKAPSDMVLPSSHFFDPRYVGPAVSYEMQKMYYKRNTFSVCSVEKSVQHFLDRHTGYSMQKWMYGVPPNRPPTLKPFPPFFAAEHVRSLQVRVKLEHFYSEMHDAEFFFDRYAYEQCFYRRTRRDLMGLTHYLDRRPKGKVEIEFVMMSKLPSLSGLLLQDDRETARLERNRIFVNFLECVRPMVYKAMHDYKDISVKVTHYDPAVGAFPRDITGMFGLTKKQWRHEKNKQRGRAEWELDFFVMRQGAEGFFLSGLDKDDMDDILLERWGMENAMDRQASHAVKRGRFWPVAVKGDGTW